ncbi:MAG: hypothetical protein MMC23_008652 [Stictis urceolatum]|nr:hypothetical protein [Stictis urceolata]
MILINPGGPGGSGVNEVRGNGTLIQAIVGTNWDIVGFDPRGMWLSEPKAYCPLNSTQLQHRSVPRLTDDFYNSFIEAGKELGALCEKTSGGDKDAGPYMSTAVTARDMASIVDAFAETEDGKKAAKNCRLLNYYGISYGSFLGQTFASMFPDRVGNLVIDGIVSPTGYLANYANASINHLDCIFAAFFIYCHEAGESLCPYYTGSTPKDIFERFNHSFAQLDARKAQAENWSNATEIELALLTLKVEVLGAAYRPLSTFGQLAGVLLGLETALATNDISTWIKLTQLITGDPTPVGNENPEWTLGVICSDQDNKLYNKSLKDLQPIIEGLEAQSIFGEIWIKSALGCPGWSIKAKEIFTGPFSGDTATPILFVSNSLDPVTPIEESVVPYFWWYYMLTEPPVRYRARQTTGMQKFLLLTAWA